MLLEDHTEHISLYRHVRKFMVDQVLHFDLAGFLVNSCNRVVDYRKHASAMMTYEELWVTTNDDATCSI